MEQMALIKGFLAHLCGVWLNVCVGGPWYQQFVCLAARRHRHQEYAKAHNLYYYGPNAVNGGQP